MQQFILIFIFFISYVCYNTYYLKLSEAIFAINKPFSKRLVSSIFSALVGTIFLYFFKSMSSLGYAIMLFVYSATVIAYFKNEHIITRIACILTFNIHIMVARALCSSLYSIISQRSIYDLSTNLNTFWFILILTTYMSLLFTVAILKIVKPKYLKVMKQKTELMYAYVAITALANIFLITDGVVYIRNISYVFLPYFQIIAALTWLLAMYVCMFMLVGFDMLRDKKEALEQDSFYKNLLVKSSVIVVELDVYKNTIIKLYRNGVETVLEDPIYTNYISYKATRSVKYEDSKTFLKLVSPLYIIDSFDNSEFEYSFNFRTTGRKTNTRWLRANVIIHKNSPNDNLVAVLSLIDDVHDNIIKEQQLQASAKRDSHLGVLNKVATANTIDKLLENGTEGALFLIDLDNFKAINDNFGHTYGDEVLLDVISKIIKNFRKDDVIGRIGGDEFIVFLNTPLQNFDINSKASDVCRSILNDYVQNDMSITVSASIGISLAPRQGKSFAELYKLADASMYESKRTGKNKFTIHKENHP